MSRFTLVLAAATLAGCTADYTVEELVETSSFPIGITSVDIDLDVGHVELLGRANDLETTWLEVTSRWSKTQPAWSAEIVGTTLVVTGDCPRQPACATHMRLRVPTYADALVETGAGELRLGRMDSDLVVHTDAGGVEVLQQTGRMELETGAGEIRVTDTRGDLFAFTNAGGIEVTDHEGDFVDLATDGGSIDGEGITAGEVHATSDAGSVYLDVPGGAWRLDLDTGAGAIRLDGVTHDNQASRTLRARTGAGDLEVHGR